MPFRDDAEALRSRVEVLETDLKRTERELERSRESVAEAAALRAALAKIEAQLAEVRGERVNPRAQRTAAAVLAGGMVFVVVGAMVAQSTVRHGPVVVTPRSASSHARPVMLPSVRTAPEGGWFAPRVFAAHVDEALGDAPIPAGSACDVLVASTDIDMLDCRVTVTCNAELVYGGEGQGYLPCRVVDGEPTTGEDLSGTEDDGDPMLDLDLPRRRIVITNDQPSIWRMELRVFKPALEPAPLPAIDIHP